MLGGNRAMGGTVFVDDVATTNNYSTTWGGRESRHAHSLGRRERSRLAWKRAGVGTSAKGIHPSGSYSAWLRFNSMMSPGHWKPQRMGGVCTWRACNAAS